MNIERDKSADTFDINILWHYNLISYENNTHAATIVWYIFISNDIRGIYAQTFRWQSKAEMGVT